MMGNPMQMMEQRLESQMRQSNPQLYEKVRQMMEGKTPQEMQNTVMNVARERGIDLNQFASYADRWTPDNPESDIPAAFRSSSNQVVSTRVIEDASFLRLKTLTLGYTIPAKLLKNWKISSARVYVAGQNLWTISGYSGYDPEVSIRTGALTPGLDYSAYPRAYAVNFGVSLGF